jgi:hypothetical protein
MTTDPAAHLSSQGRLDAFLQRYNKDAALLRATLNAYEGYLQRAREEAVTHGAAGVSHAVPGISHEAAVHEWHLLLRKVAHCGNFFLLAVSHGSG